MTNGFADGTFAHRFVCIPPDAITRAIQAPPVKERLALIAAEPVPVSSAGFQKYFNDDVERFARLVREGKIQPLR